MQPLPMQLVQVPIQEPSLPSIGLNNQSQLQAEDHAPTNITLGQPNMPLKTQMPV